MSRAITVGKIIQTPRAAGPKYTWQLKVEGAQFDSMGDFPNISEAVQDFSAFCEESRDILKLHREGPEV